MTSPSTRRRQSRESVLAGAPVDSLNARVGFLKDERGITATAVAACGRRFLLSGAAVRTAFHEAMHTAKRERERYASDRSDKMRSGEPRVCVLA